MLIMTSFSFCFLFSCDLVANQPHTVPQISSTGANTATIRIQSRMFAWSDKGSTVGKFCGEILVSWCYSICTHVGGSKRLGPLRHTRKWRDSVLLIGDFSIKEADVGSVELVEGTFPRIRV
ncbi:hypothetical protein BDZ91DRAFT_744407 [Kalaharituber pfeilii]|nr:hypothetical protein BDZ91DRAFT_744407 [Kalaharituber pfeilii]